MTGLVKWALLALIPIALTSGFGTAAEAVVHAAFLEYIPFILLLLALFTVAGGIVVRGNIHGAPLTNTMLLAIGAAMASVIGTTGAAMIMIRPVIRANDDRRHNVHVIVFFIFLVANAGGALTPLGDPPLFVGFLKGVDFFWTTQHLLAETLFVGGIVLWSFSNLRFQAEMAQLLVFLMVLNMFGAITVVPAFYSILRPKVATALLTDEQREAIRVQKARERELGLRDD